MSDNRQELNGIFTLFIFGLAATAIVVGSIWGLNALHCTYHVWAQHKAGEAELARATANRQIAIQEALAKQESAKYLAEAEVARAEGVAKANKIIGTSLQNNEAYLRYLWIDGLHTGKSQVIYVPTEANLPILEAGRGGGLCTERDQQ